jgi:hypothetical protein
MQQYYFELPFANTGDKTAIPITVQSDGSISFPDGYSIVYQDDLDTNPAALPIDRETFNQLMFSITQNIQNYQQYGFPEFITAANNGGVAFPYDAGSIVRYSSSGTAPFQTFISLAANNTEIPVNDGVMWTQAVTLNQFTNGSQTFSYGTIYWRKTPDNFLEQWGSISNFGAGARSANIVLPRSFVDTNYTVVCSDTAAACYSYGCTPYAHNGFTWYMPAASLGTGIAPTASGNCIANFYAKGQSA